MHEHTRARAFEATVRKVQHPQPVGRRRVSPMLAVDDSETASSSSAGGDDGEHVHSYVERGLPNGDFYTGQWHGGAPHGAGKYLWTDRCMYEGEWRHGKATGRGKFSWPSGATYEGEFKDGFMDGSGTYTGAAGDTYRGSWSMNLKHDSEKKSYASATVDIVPNLRTKRRTPPPPPLVSPRPTHARGWPCLQIEAP